MLITRDFEAVEGLRNSDGKLIQSFPTKEYTAIYDTKIYDDSNIEDYLDDFLNERAKRREDIVILPKDTWLLIRKMMLDNYIITEKEGSDEWD